MARAGIDYFPLDVNLDIKFELIEAEFGLTGFAIIVKLLQRIYSGHGYYCEWTNEVALLFSKSVGMGGNAVSEIVSASVRRGIFDQDLFEKYQILTSAGVQKRYFEAVSRRKQIEVDDRYLLVKVEQICKNVDIQRKNVSISKENVDISKQSRVKESRVEESKKDLCAFFESVWELYPKKKGKGQVSDTQKGKLFAVGYDQLARCVQRYVDDKRDTDMQFIQNGSTFFNSGYVDYLDENYSGKGDAANEASWSHNGGVPGAGKTQPDTGTDRRDQPKYGTFV